MKQEGKVTRVRTTFTVNKKYWDRFTGLIDRLKLRRDSFLNHALWEEVKELEKVTQNSSKAEAFLKEERGHGDIWEIDGVELIKANLSLDKLLLSEINRVCSDKRIPRDIFLEEYLRFLVYGALNESCGSPLIAVVDLLENPRSRYIYQKNEKSAYDELSISDDEVEEQQNEWQEQLLIIEAIAQIKGVDIYSAKCALQKCTEEERNKIINNPDVKKKIEQLREKGEKDVDLLGLLN